MKFLGIALAIGVLFASAASFAGGEAMKIKYLGHSAFEVTTAAGKKLVFDPYTAGAFGTLGYGPITGDFDIAIVSHDHEDHTSKEVLAHSKNKVTKPGRASFEGIGIESFATFHDDAKGAKRGKNLVTVVAVDSIRLAHLGDLGHMITAKDFPSLKGVDVLFIPVGGHFTIDAAIAAAIVKEFEPKIVIPMHYKAPKVDFPIAPVENFTKLMKDVLQQGSSEIEITRETLPAQTTVIVLEPAN